MNTSRIEVYTAVIVHRNITRVRMPTSLKITNPDDLFTAGRENWLAGLVALKRHGSAAALTLLEFSHETGFSGVYGARPLTFKWESAALAERGMDRLTRRHAPISIGVPGAVDEE